LSGGKGYIRDESNERLFCGAEQPFNRLPDRSGERLFVAAYRPMRSIETDPKPTYR
jgi:hypothetical protein